MLHDGDHAGCRRDRRFSALNCAAMPETLTIEQMAALDQAYASAGMK